MHSSQDTAPNPGAADETWGIYVYFAADVPNQAMQDAAWETLNILASVGSNEKVKITAMIDLPDCDTGYYIFPRRPDDVEEWKVLPARFLSNVNSASIDTIVDFLGWSKTNCEAKNTALIFWGHGYALEDYDPRTQDVKAGFHKPTSDQSRSADGFPGESGSELKLLFDSSYNSVLNNRDFAQAIRDYTLEFNEKRPVEVLGLDCCNMAMVEVLSELQDVAKYVVAAETSLPFRSWLTKDGLENFLKQDDRTALGFAIGAVEDSVDRMAKSDPGSYVELAGCEMERFPALEKAIAELVDKLLLAIKKHENRRAIAQAWECDVSYVADGLIDLASFCDRLQSTIGKESSVEVEVADAAAEVISIVKGTEKTRGIVKCVKYAPDHPDENISLSTGLTIWFPPWIQFPNVRYFQLRQSIDYLFHGYPSTSFAHETNWDRFLRKLYDLTQGRAEDQEMSMSQGNDLGRNMPLDVKPTPKLGREDSQDGQGNGAGGGSTPAKGAPRKAGVVIRASVEHVSLVGETELTVNVKWPASTFCVPPCATADATADPSQNPLNVPSNAPSAKIRTVTGKK